MKPSKKPSIQAQTDAGIEAMQFQPTLKTYRVGVIHVLEFGVEVEVQAANKREARKLALSRNAELASGDSYDWDRQDLAKVKPLKGGECSELEDTQ